MAFIQNPSTILVRPFVLEASLAYRNKKYVNTELFPMFDGLNKQAKIPKYVKGPWFRDEAQIRAPGADPVRGGMNLASHNLDPLNYAYSTSIADEYTQYSTIEGNFPGLDIETTAAIFCADKLDMKREIIASALLHATNWNSVGAGGEDAAGHWGGDSSAEDDTFIADISKGRLKILSETGEIPNRLFMDTYCHESVQKAPALLSYINPTSESRRDPFVSLQTLANLAQVEKVIVGYAIKNTAEETVLEDTFTPVNIWGTSGEETKGVAFLYYAPERPSLLTPSAGYQYRVKKGSGTGRDIWTARNDLGKATHLACEEDVDISATGLDCGYMWKNTAVT